MATGSSNTNAGKDTASAFEKAAHASESAESGASFAEAKKDVSFIAAPPDASGEAAQGRTREVIAVWLLGLLCAIVGLAFTAYFLTLDGVEPDKRFEHLKTLLDVLVGPILTLLSSAIGFYFGARSAQAGHGPAAVPAPAQAPPPAPPAPPPPAPAPATTTVVTPVPAPPEASPAPAAPDDAGPDPQPTATP